MGAPARISTLMRLLSAAFLFKDPRLIDDN
jgi:hypothetical protein